MICIFPFFVLHECRIQRFHSAGFYALLYKAKTAESARTGATIQKRKFNCTQNGGMITSLRLPSCLHHRRHPHPHHLSFHLLFSPRTSSHHLPPSSWPPQPHSVLSTSPQSYRPQLC